MRIKELKISKIDLTFVIVVIAFMFSEFTTSIDSIDAFFSLMERYKIKYVLALIMCMYYMCKSGFGLKGYFSRETKYYLLNVGVLSIISLVLQVINGFKGDLINEALYFIVPIVFAYTLINAKKGVVDSCINIIFYTTIILFIISFRTSFNLNALLSIDFVESYSPFEGGPAFISLVLTMYYRYRRDWPKTILSALVCILSFKRMTFIFCVLVLFLYDKILRIKWKQKTKILVCIFLILPILIQIICSDSFAQSFYSATGLDLNVFVKGRFDSINLVVDSDEIKYGLGSCRLYLSRFYRNLYNTGLMYDTHCDIIRFYLECGIVGSFSLAYCYFKSASKSNVATFLMFYIFIECSVNHIFGGGNTLYWILTYLVLFCFQTNERDKKYDVAKSEIS